MLEESGFPSFAIHVFTHVMREADELFEINSKLLLEFLELDKARYFTKGTTGWTHIEDFITCRIDAELKNTHFIARERGEEVFSSPSAAWFDLHELDKKNQPIDKQTRRDPKAM